jgi:hypothetical protein
MRELTSHKVNRVNDGLTVCATDERGHSNANHVYEIEWGNTDGHDMTGHDQRKVVIPFQNGPIAEVGTNGVTHEALLAILADRLEGFESGQYSCFENQQALYHVREAIGWLKHRTEKRLARGVEGTHTV